MGIRQSKHGVLKLEGKIHLDSKLESNDETEVNNNHFHIISNKNAIYSA